MRPLVLWMIISCPPLGSFGRIFIFYSYSTFPVFGPSALASPVAKRGSNLVPAGTPPDVSWIGTLSTYSVLLMMISQGPWCTSSKQIKDILIISRMVLCNVALSVRCTSCNQTPIPYSPNIPLFPAVSTMEPGVSPGLHNDLRRS